ncbi:PilZ domain-containing protein (plasmid) [Rossellomorea sp. AcN35-11]|nr:PilZ domain-containing protein [Rossellomorea aquimaris]WJV32243.1 PilZ domain-containing protein [Rossellomorea sp. AcN35-11]
MIIPGIGVKVKVKSEGGIYTSRIVDFNSNEIMLEYPVNISDGKTGLFYKGETLDVTFVGEDGVMYKYKPTLKRKKRDNIPLVVLDAPTTQNVKRIQRREYVRVSDTKGVSLILNDKVLSGVLLNISAGGIAVKMDKSLDIQVGDKVFCEFLLANSLVGFKCEVKRVSINDSDFKLSMQYDDINSSDREMITRYVFSKQVELRKKGVL